MKRITHCQVLISWSVHIAFLILSELKSLNTCWMFSLRPFSTEHSQIVFFFIFELLFQIKIWLKRIEENKEWKGKWKVSIYTKRDVKERCSFLTSIISVALRWRRRCILWRMYSSQRSLIFCGFLFLFVVSMVAFQSPKRVLESESTNPEKTSNETVEPNEKELEEQFFRYVDLSFKFSNTHIVANVGIIANFVFPYNFNFLLYLHNWC